MATVGEKADAATIAVTNVSVTSLVNGTEPAQRSTTANEVYTPPPITTSQSAEYRDRLAEITSRATIENALNVTFEQERTGRSVQVTPAHIYASAKIRVNTMVESGGFVVEAGNFAAVALWQSPSAPHAYLSEEQLHTIADEGRPIFAQFVREIQEAQRVCFGSDHPPPMWWLSLMARDPARNREKGAVRAVIEPFVQQARQEKVPVWLIAGTERARDVYAYFGFRVVKVITSYVPGEEERSEGVKSWCMVCNWPVEEV
jgi:hypothetical protein